jgi:hypothetical protein
MIAMKVLTLSITFWLFICIPFACKTKKMTSDATTEGTELTDRCKMKHEPGPCRGAFTRYYYDQKEGKCMSFIYGGCQGSVPFETLEDCQAACER